MTCMVCCRPECICLSQYGLLTSARQLLSRSQESRSSQSDWSSAVAGSIALPAPISGDTDIRMMMRRPT